jgi:lycopene beta-cyclase
VGLRVEDRSEASAAGKPADTTKRSRGPVSVPDKLDRSTRDHYAFVILGAGCSGLSLCYCLLERGVDAPILILDRKRTFEDDRTWCFWDVEPTPFTQLALKEWRSWDFLSAGRSVTQTTNRYPYKCLASRDFYQHALARLAESPNVTVRLGEEVRGYTEENDEVRVETSGGTLRSRQVFDGCGLPPGSPVFEEARRKATWVPQKFLGLRIRAHKPVFDPERCTLMDFSVDQLRGLRFVYVLPMGEREALVENVYLSEADVSQAEHRAEIGVYLESIYGLSPDEYEVLGEERGYIPMTDHAFPRRLGERTHNIGMLGGETRPSTGYTFLRIQRHCRALAAAVASGADPPERTHTRRLDLLDSLFLRFVRERPGDCPEVYRRMFAGVPPDSLVRFLTEKSTPLDEARLIRALPKTPFLKLAAHTLIESSPAPGP